MQKTPTILIATDQPKDAEAVKQPLTHDYKNVFTSTKPDMAVTDFEQHRPDVLVLAFQTLELAQSYYLRLFRFSTLCPHRTVILCNREQIRTVYTLCKKNYFDDYILYWPVSHDDTRLAMAVHHALRDLAAFNANLSALKIATLTRKIAGMEALLKRNTIQSNDYSEATSRLLTSIEQEANDALDGFLNRLTEDINVKELNDDICRKQEALQNQFLALAESLRPLDNWVQTFREESIPYLKAACELRVLAEKVPATILVVDDEEPSRTLLKRLLEQKNYQLMFAASGIEALNQLHSV